MSLRHKPLNEIEEADLQALVDNATPERKTIEYKETLPSNDYDGKKEFLADVSSFANAAGGDLIFGIREENGLPVEVCGLDVDNIDAEKQRLENMMRDSIEPRIFSPDVRGDITVKGSKVAIVIRIPKSWNAPHVVKLQKHWRFYSRNSAGKYPLDVSELRTLFELSGTIAERIRNFRAERLGRIIAGETLVEMIKGGKIILHLVPFGAFDPASGLDLSSIPYDTLRSMKPIGNFGWNHRYNFDGFLTYGTYQDAPPHPTYSQLFRNGIVETVDSYRLGEKGEPSIPMKYESEVVETISEFLQMQKAIGIDLPIVIMLSLTGVLGYTMAAARRFMVSDIHPIDRDVLLTPEITIESFDRDPTEFMRPAFDTVWNAAGYPRSQHYNDAGDWIGSRR